MRGCWFSHLSCHSCMRLCRGRWDDLELWHHLWACRRAGLWWWVHHPYGTHGRVLGGIKQPSRSCKAHSCWQGQTPSSDLWRRGIGACSVHNISPAVVEWVTPCRWWTSNPHSYTVTLDRREPPEPVGGPRGLWQRLCPPPYWAGRYLSSCCSHCGRPSFCRELLSWRCACLLAWQSPSSTDRAENLSPAARRPSHSLTPGAGHSLPNEPWAYHRWIATLRVVPSPRETLEWPLQMQAWVYGLGDQLLPM